MRPSPQQGISKILNYCNCEGPSSTVFRQRRPVRGSQYTLSATLPRDLTMSWTAQMRDVAEDSLGSLAALLTVAARPG